MHELFKKIKLNETVVIYSILSNKVTNRFLIVEKTSLMWNTHQICKEAIVMFWVKILKDFSFFLFLCHEKGVVVPLEYVKTCCIHSYYDAFKRTK